MEPKAPKATVSAQSLSQLLALSPPRLRLLKGQPGQVTLNLIIDSDPSCLLLANVWKVFPGQRSPVHSRSSTFRAPPLLLAVERGLRTAPWGGHPAGGRFASPPRASSVK